jgi:hypothetical protein
MAINTTNSVIELPRMSIQRMNVTLIGTSSLIVHRFSEKSKREMLDKQTKKASTGKAAKNPEDDFQNSMYLLGDGRHGFPAVAFKAAAVTACTSLAGITKVAARQAFHISGVRSIGQGSHAAAVTSDELVPLLCLDPIMREDMVRVGMGTSDIRYRAEYWPWAVDLDVRYNPNAFSAEQVLNLFNVAGFAVGIGEWRSERNGINGSFRVSEAADDAVLDELREATLKRHPVAA